MKYNILIIMYCYIVILYACTDWNTYKSCLILLYNNSFFILSFHPIFPLYLTIPHSYTLDPHTPYIFDGEEFSRSMRYWTHGYDVYTPNRIYVVHDYHLSQVRVRIMTSDSV